MAAKLEPCMTENRKHTWEWLRNFDRKTITMNSRGTSIHVACKGLYRCVTCAARKEGPTQYHPAKEIAA